MNIPSALERGLRQQREAEDEAEDDDEETGGAALRQHDSPGGDFTLLFGSFDFQNHNLCTLSLVKYLKQKQIYVGCANSVFANSH